MSANCEHFHASNYDPAKVVAGQPVEVLGDGRMWCFDCERFFSAVTHAVEPKSSLPRLYTADDVEAIAMAFADSGERNEGGRLHVQATMLEFMKHFRAEDEKGSPHENQAS